MYAPRPCRPSRRGALLLLLLLSLVLLTTPSRADNDSLPLHQRDAHAHANVAESLANAEEDGAAPADAARDQKALEDGLDRLNKRHGLDEPDAKGGGKHVDGDDDDGDADDDAGDDADVAAVDKALVDNDDKAALKGDDADADKDTQKNNDADDDDADNDNPNDDPLAKNRKELDEIDALLAETKKEAEEEARDKNDTADEEDDDELALTDEDKAVLKRLRESVRNSDRRGGRFVPPEGLAAAADPGSLKRLDDAAGMPDRAPDVHMLAQDPAVVRARREAQEELEKTDPDAAEAMRPDPVPGELPAAREAGAKAEKGRLTGETEEVTDEVAEVATAQDAIALLKEVSSLTKDLDSTQKQLSETREKVKRDNVMYEEALKMVREEVKGEKDELLEAIEERKRAFEELFEEKKMLSSILASEEKTLKDLQEKIQHPDLGVWMKQRAERAAILMEGPETDAVKYYASKFMAPKVSKMRHRLSLLEKRVERSVDHLLPAKYGGVVAVLLSIFLVAFPVVVTMSTVVSVTKSVSLRQYVLLGNVFLCAFSFGLLVAGVMLRQDPLQTLYEASEGMFMLLQLVACIAFPLFLALIVAVVLRARDDQDMFVFGCELLFYILVGVNYRARVWRPAMLGENIDTSRMMYVVYFIDMLSMTALTVSSSRGNDEVVLPTVMKGGSGKTGARLPSGSSVSAVENVVGNASRFGSGIIGVIGGGSASAAGKEE